MSKKESEKYKHLKFERYYPPTTAPMKKRPGYGKSPKDKDVITHGKELSKKIEEVEKEKNRVKEKIYPPDLDPQLIFIIEQESEGDDILEVDEENLSRSGIQILEKEGGKWIIVFATDGHARRFKENLHIYQKKVLRDGAKVLKKPKFSYLFNNIKEIIPRFPENRLCEKLREFYLNEEFPSDFIEIRIDFWWLGRDITQTVMELCEKLLIKYKCKLITSYRNYGMASIVTMINLEALKDIVEITEIYRIEIIEELPPDKSKVSTISLKHFPNIKISEVSNKPMICLIDTGVIEKHPILEGSIVKSLLRTDETDIDNDEDGHGTQLTGTILFGNLEEKIETKEIYPQGRIVSVKIAKEIRKKNVSDFNNTIIDSIQTVHDNLGCKLFLLTYLPSHLPLEPDIRTRNHQLSIMLDRLINELNIVVVVPIGNQNFEKVNLNKLKIEDIENGKYTNILFNSKILEGASANSALTIGSIAGKDVYPSSHSSINIASIKIISKKEDPALYTRTGPGLGNCIKPDLSAIGGNWIYYPDRTFPFITLEDLAFFGPKFDALTSNLLDYDIGTCISASYTCHLILRLMDIYPGHTGNYYRALISNRSIPPNPSELFLQNNNIFESNEKGKYLNLFGFGIANDKQLFYGNPKTITLFYEGEIPLNEVHSFEIPVPESFKKTNDNRGITVTLSYNPPVVPRKSYRAVNLSFRYIYKKADTKDIYNYFSEIKDEEVLDEVPSESRYNFDVDYSSKVRNKSTLKTARYSWKEFPKGTRNTTYQKMEENSHFIVIHCKPKGWFDANAYGVKDQSYCVIVTIWHDTSTRIYEQVQQKVREPIRLRP